MKLNAIVFGMLCACLVAATGCSTSSGPSGPLSPPGAVHVSGVVKLPNGLAVRGAWVTVTDVDTTFADSLGAYSLDVPESSNTVLVRASTYSERGIVHVGDYFGSATVWVGGRDAHLDVVLDHFVAL